MKKVIVDRCCGNCEWSISPENEKEIMIENHYEEDDPTRPRAGDCCLGVEHNGSFVCNQHDYLSGGLETHVFYDDKDLGPGYYVVSTYCDHILKFFKLYRTGEYGNYSYGIRTADLFPINNEISNGVSFEIGNASNELLYKAITIFANGLDKDVLWSTDEKNFMSVNVYEHSTGLYFTGSKDNNFIDIKIDDNNEKKYKLISVLYRNMAAITGNIKNEQVSRKIRKLNK